MAADPFPPHRPASDLEASTAMTPVTDEAMDHAAKHAAELLKTVARSSRIPAPRGGRGGRKAPDSAQSVSEVTAVGSAEPEAVGHAEPEAASAIPGDPSQTEQVAEQTGGSRGAIVGPEQAKGGDASGAVENDHSNSPDTLARFNSKAAEAIRTNIDAGFAFWTSMMKVKSAAEAVSLNAQHLGRQLETFTAQSRELSTLAQQLVTESLRSFSTSSNQPK